MSTTTVIIIVNAVLMTGIVAAIVGLCAHAIVVAPKVERQHRRSRAPRRRAPRSVFVRHPMSGMS